MGNKTIQDTSFFNEKREKNREKTGKTGEKTLKKGRKKTRKTEEKNRKLQEIQKQDFDEVPGNAENRNKFSARFREMLKTETRTKTRSSQMSRNGDSRAKTRSRCRPSTRRIHKTRLDRALFSLLLTGRCMELSVEEKKSI